MAYSRAYGVQGAAYIDDPMVKMVIDQNMEADPTIYNQLDLPDGMNRYQEELLNARWPEKRVRGDEDGGEEEVRNRSKKIMNLHHYGNVLGDTDLAYKPEIEQVPQPNIKISENKYNLFQREKRLMSQHAFRGEAQKDSIMLHPMNEPKYRHADTRKYIPDTIRTMQKITIEDHVVPLRERMHFIKRDQEFRHVENENILTYCIDAAHVNKKKVTLKRGQSTRPDVDVTPDQTNVNMMLQMVKGNYDRTKRLNQEHGPITDDDVIAKKDRKQPKLVKNNLRINNIEDLVNISDKINTIQRTMEKGTIRPKLGLSTILPMPHFDSISGISDKAPKRAKASTFILHKGMEHHDIVDDKESYVDGPDIKRKKIAVRLTDNVSPTFHHDQIAQQKKTTELKKSALRNLVTELDHIGDNVRSMTSKVSTIQKKDLSFSVVGHNTADDTTQNSFRTKFDLNQSNGREYHRGDPIIMNYEDNVSTIQAKSFDDKSKQNRKVHPDALNVSADPYTNNIKKPRKPLSESAKNEFMKNDYQLRRD